MEASIRRAVLAAAVAFAAMTAAGCEGGDGGAGSPAGAYETSFSEEWKRAPERRLEQLQRDYAAGVDMLGDDTPPNLEVHELWLGRIGGRSAEIDIQTELVGEGVSVGLYDEISRETLASSPDLVLEETTPYTDFDGEEAVVFEFRSRVPGVLASRIASTVHDGYAYNVSLTTMDPATRREGDDVLRGVVGSWNWIEE